MLWYLAQFTLTSTLRVREPSQFLKDRRWGGFESSQEHRGILLQLCPSVLPFVFAVLSLPSFNFLSGYFYVSLNFVAVTSV